MKEYALIFLIALVTSVLGAWYLPDRPLPEVRSSSVPNLSGDPVIGSPLPKELEALVGATDRSPSSTPRSILVVSGGSCGGCSREALKLDLLPAKEFDAVVVFFQATEREIASHVKNRLPQNVFLVSDAGERILRTLNAKWTGRWYRFDHGALSRLERSPGTANW